MLNSTNDQNGQNCEGVKTKGAELLTSSQREAGKRVILGSLLKIVLTDTSIPNEEKKAFIKEAFAKKSPSETAFV